jgi:hypothetical protein
MRSGRRTPLPPMPLSELPALKALLDSALPSAGETVTSRARGRTRAVRGSAGRQCLMAHPVTHCRRATGAPPTNRHSPPIRSSGGGNRRRDASLVL